MQPHEGDWLLSLPYLHDTKVLNVDFNMQPVKCRLHIGNRVVLFLFLRGRTVGLEKQAIRSRRYSCASCCF